MHDYIIDVYWLLDLSVVCILLTYLRSPNCQQCKAWSENGYQRCKIEDGGPGSVHTPWNTSKEKLAMTKIQRSSTFTDHRATHCLPCTIDDHQLTCMTDIITSDASQEKHFLLSCNMLFTLIIFQPHNNWQNRLCHTGQLISGSPLCNALWCSLTCLILKCLLDVFHNFKNLWTISTILIPIMPNNNKGKSNIAKRWHRSSVIFARWQHSSLKVQLCGCIWDPILGKGRS